MMNKLLQDVLYLTAQTIGPRMEQIGPVEAGRIHVYNSFQTYWQGEQPGQVAYGQLCDRCEELHRVGLTIVDFWSDNDSWGGYIERMG
jgi:hypothetical protein